MPRRRTTRPGQQLVCGHCAGTGIVFSGPRGGNYGDNQRCPECEGTGRRPSKAEQQRRARCGKCGGTGRIIRMVDLPPERIKIGKPTNEAVEVDCPECKDKEQI